MPVILRFEYAETLGLPFVFSSNGDCVLRDATRAKGEIEQNVRLHGFLRRTP